MKRLMTLLIIALSTGALAQEAGNAVYDMANKAYEGNAYSYGNNNYNSYSKTNQGNNNVYLPNDTVYTIGARVMINIQPDLYVAVFGVSQEGLTVSDCNKQINDRIEKFKSSLKNNGVKDEDLFVDLIAQTRIYDYKITGKTATETKQGFEIKKNVIFKFTDHSLVEKMMLLAAEQDIYDIVKIDYLLTDPEKTQTLLRQAALEVIESKKKFIQANSSLALSDKGIIQFEVFNTVYPNDSYHQYVAAEGSYVQPSYYAHNTWVKDQRKSKTFYFEKLNPATFDKIINPVSVKIPVQVTLDIKYKFYLPRPDKKTSK